MSKSLFVSYVFEDKAHFDAVKRWAAEGKLGADVAVTSETKDVRQDGDAAIRSHVKPFIQGSAAVLLLLGKDTHNHHWVRTELSVAASLGKAIIVARIPGTMGAAPEGFGHLTPIAFDPSAIKGALG
jgi:hypothetical protein